MTGKYEGKDFVVGRVWDCDVRCDRQTPRGNPYVLRNKHSSTERQQRVEEFKADLWKRMKRRDPRTVRLLKDLSDRQEKLGRPLKLGCHCSPLLCHCDVWAAAVDWCRETGYFDPPVQAQQQELILM